MREGPIIAIDGPSGAGKSTVARRLAARLGIPHVDTGALYRAVTLAVLRAGVDPEDAGACAAVAKDVQIERRDGRTLIDGEDVEGEIRDDPVTRLVSTVSAHPEIREAMIPVQRAAASAAGGVVEGRDIGTVVFPDADFKVFLTASHEARTRRRAAELGQQDLEAVSREIQRRDAVDSARAVAPLTQAEDAWEIDTTAMDIDEAVEAIASLARAVWAQQGHDTLLGEEEDGEDEEPEETVTTIDLALEPEETVTAIDLALEPEETSGRAAEVLAARRALPRVAVVGRPNVGKSTLVNRIIGARAAIVEEKPGVTRDRTEHLASWLGRNFAIVDTGGWEHSPEGMAARVVEQAERAIAGADLVLFVVDVTVGAQADDEAYARLLRRAERPVILVANKADSEKQLPYAHELYGLGLGDPQAVSAAHGRGVGDLLDAMIAALPDTAPESPPDEEDVPRVAVVGRPNVGKSSLFNRLVGQERSIVDPVPHTTRDAVDTLVAFDDEPWVFVDTAGLRRRYRHGEDAELYSADRTRRAVEVADLVLFVVDASEAIGEQDQRLAAMVRDAGCGVVVVLNKWDLVDEERRHDLERELDRLLGFTAWAPRVNVSALTGRGVGRLVPRLRAVWDACRTRVPTAELNRWLDEVTRRVPPPAGRGRRPVRVKFITQAEARPPTFLAFANGTLAPAYVRYLERELRASYEFEGTPLKIEQRRGSRR
ncbi:MAG: ribosome biogenesis GTPase Der [Nitriliruptorales bacterium]